MQERIVVVLIFVLGINMLFSQSNLAETARINTSNSHEEKLSLITDGKEDTYWVSDEVSASKSITLVLTGATEIKRLNLKLSTIDDREVETYQIQTLLNGKWGKVAEKKEKGVLKEEIVFDKSILVDRLRLFVKGAQAIKVHEIEIYGEKYIDASVGYVKKILVNQSGYNKKGIKRFTAPETADETVFILRNLKNQEIAFKGQLKNRIGDFSEFQPESKEEYQVEIDTLTSFPFTIAPNWIERVSYRNMVDFMIGARHYVGSTDKIRGLSWAWRDGDFFNWALQSLVAMYLSNPEAYHRMETNVKYVRNETFSKAYKEKWGLLEPYSEKAPDVVKLIHWDADVKLSQQLDHEHQKAELAHFLYAYPYLKKWLPQQNFDVVYAYLKKVWTKETVAKHSTTHYNKSESHNLLKLKTKMGTTKGELPPGASVIPNLMMYEVAKRMGDQDAEKYFTAAFNQLEWMINNLDWKDPIVTKGQRMSEHITMRAFAFFYTQYPNRHPKGLAQKVDEWIGVMLSRSQNMWDFRKYTDDGDWVSAGWNETGNILGFPAAVLAAKSITSNVNFKNELDKLAWSHIDNAFGRNPTGRHFSYDGPSEIEGVDQGWFSFHHGGIGLLEEVPFVFDGSPKTNHYPNHPEIGNLGWTEGWVQFNTAYNLSMAYLAADKTKIKLKRKNRKTLEIRLQVPLNFEVAKEEPINLLIKNLSGDEEWITLKETDNYSTVYSGTISFKKGKYINHDQKLQYRKGDEIEVSYGLGYFTKKAKIRL